MTRYPVEIRQFLMVLTIVLPALLLSGCRDGQDEKLDFLVDTEGRTYEGTEVSSERIEELRRDIERYEKEIEAAVQAHTRSASYHKLLAQELLKEEMYGPALEALQRAMELQPANPVVYYYAGVAAARTGRAHMLSGEEDRYLALAESYFSEAIRLRENYQDAIFAMAVLLAFDLNRPDEALEYSRKLSEIETGDPAVKFLHGNILVQNGLFREAIDVYDDLARSAPSSEQRARARQNRDELERNL
jgi:tetratricopeptide (TPR) repeat protein